MKKSAKEKGFTLIEIIAVVGILGIIMLMVGNFFSATINVYVDESTISQIQSDARRVLNSITQDIRLASSITIVNKNELLLTYEDRADQKYKIVEGKNELYCGSNLLSKNIKSINFSKDDKMDNLIIYLTAQKTGSAKTYDLSSSVAIDKNISIITKVEPIINPQPYNDLLNFEKNVLNIMNNDGNSTDISFNNVTFNPRSNSSVLIQGNSVAMNGFGNNLQANIAIKANTLSLGGQLGTSSGCEAIFDINKIEGTMTMNSKIYVPEVLVTSNANFNNISSYRGEFWKFLFEKEGDCKTRSMGVRKLQDNIDFSDININPNQELNLKIHYFSGKISNEIKDNYLPDFMGNPNTCKVNTSQYEYIICHGPLTIYTSYNYSNPTIRDFNFKGLIYCDDEVTIKDLDSTFQGIIIARGLAVTSREQRNWNISFDDNSANGSLDKINKVINNIVENAD